MALAAPSYAVNCNKRGMHAAAGRQAGVGASKLAFDPLVDVRDNKLAHMSAAIDLAVNQGLPWDKENPLGEDLKFAVDTTKVNRDEFRSFRQASSTIWIDPPRTVAILIYKHNR